MAYIARGLASPFQNFFVDATKLEVGCPGQCVDGGAAEALRVIGSVRATMSRLTKYSPSGLHAVARVAEGGSASSNRRAMRAFRAIGCANLWRRQVAGAPARHHTRRRPYPRIGRGTTAGLVSRPRRPPAGCRVAPWEHGSRVCLLQPGWGIKSMGILPGRRSRTRAIYYNKIKPNKESEKLLQIRTGFLIGWDRNPTIPRARIPDDRLLLKTLYITASRP